MKHEGIVTAARALIGVVAAASVVVGSGCAGRSKTGDLRGSVPLSAIGERDRAAEAAAPVDARRLPMFDGGTGEAVEWPALLSRASESDVVVIGETHGHVVGLDAAACLFDDLLGASPQTALAMEFFERDQQAALDDYLTGVTDEEAFLKATGRSKGNYPDGHARMVEAAKAAGRPVIGANSPRRYVRLARTEGFDRLVALGESQRALFVVPAALTEGRYRDEFMKMATSMAGHGAPEKEEELTPEEKERKAQEEALGFFRSQNLWDATMAESIVRLVAAGAEPVVMVVGRFHSEYDGGLTQRVRESLPSARVLTVTMVDESSDALREEDKGRGGVVVYVGKDGE
jgi:uncharacterized iron-regulated protein